MTILSRHQTTSLLTCSEHPILVAALLRAITSLHYAQCELALLK